MQTNKSQDVTNQEYQEFMLMFEQMRAQGLNPRVCDTPVPYYENKVPAHKRPAEARELRRMEVQSFRHNVKLWDEADAPVAGARFEAYLRIANATLKAF